MTRHFFASIFLLFLQVFFQVSTCFSQGIPEKALEKPKKYILPSQSLNYKLSNDRNAGEYWVVFSDRTINPTYKEATSIERKSVIQFMDWFYVAEETHTRVHIVKDPDLDYGNFSDDAVDYGWIDKSKLLLWDHCLVDPKSGTNKKAITITRHIENKGLIRQETGTSELAYFYDPNLSHKSFNDLVSGEVYYIYKYSDDKSSVLMGKIYYTAANQIKEDVLGWVDTTSFLDFGNYITIEPNWEEKSAIERKEKNYPFNIFSTEFYAKRYADCKKFIKKSIIWNDDPFEKRRDGSYLRFPILDIDTEEGIMKIGLLLIDESNSNQLIYTTGYTPFSIVCLESKPFKYELLFNRQELSGLLTRFDKMIQVLTESDNRKALKQYWLTNLSERQENIGTSQPDSLTIFEANQILFGTKGNCNFGDMEIRELDKDNLEYEDGVQKFLINLKQKRLELYNIYNSKSYRYGFESNLIYYYWISEDLLP